MAVPATVTLGMTAQASTSTRRLQGPSMPALTVMRMRSVLTGVKVNCRQTLSLPVTLPPVTVLQPLPFQYWTSNSVTP